MIVNKNVRQLIPLAGYLLLLIATLLNSKKTCAQGKHAWKEGSAGGYTYRYVTNDPMRARFYTLKNGLKVILSVNKREPRIHAYIGVRAGSNQDPRNNTGLAHYLEHLLFKGTDKFGSLDWSKEKPFLDQIEALYDTYNRTTDETTRKTIYRRIDSISGLAAKYAIPNEYIKMMKDMGAQETNAHTWMEETVYKENIPSNAINKYLAVQAERFRYPVFRLFHTELETVYEEKNRTLDNDDRKIYEAQLMNLFPTHHYGQSTIGTTEHLKNPSLKAIRQYYDTWYVPNNMAIVMAGDLDPDVVIRQIDEHFSFMQAKPLQEYKGPVEAAIQAPVVKEVWGPDAERVNISFRMPGESDNNRSILLRVLWRLLYNEKSGLLDVNINKQQKILEASTSPLLLKDYSVFSLVGKARKGQSLEEVKTLLLEQVEALKKGAFDESMIKAIRNNTKRAELQGMERNLYRVTSLMDGFIQHRGQHWDATVSFADNIGRVTKEEIIDFANKYLGDNYVAVYKRNGEEKGVEKIVKPVITPVTVNRDAQSPFLKTIAAMPAQVIKPQWLDYDKDIQKTKVGPAEMLSVQNKENSFFRLQYSFEIGPSNNKLLELATEYLQFLGTDQYTAKEMDRALYNAACSLRIKPGGESVSFIIFGLQENFDKAVQLFEQQLTRCRPDEAALAALKERVQKERADNKLNKMAISFGLGEYARYGPKNYYNYQLSQTELNAVTAQELVDLLHSLPAYKHKILYYGPQPSSAAEIIKKRHTLPATFKTTPTPVKFEQQDQTESQVLFVDYDMVQAEVAWIRNTTPYDPEKTAIIEMFNAYFGGGMGTIVWQTIRESKALAYGTGAFYSRPGKKEDRFTMRAFVGTQADKLDEAIASMNELLTELPYSDKQFDLANRSVKQGIETGRIVEDKIISNYLDAQRMGLKEDSRKRTYETIDQLTFDDLKQFHKQNLSGKPYTYGIIASAKKINLDALKKYGKVKKLSLEEIFGY